MKIDSRPPVAGCIRREILFSQLPEELTIEVTGQNFDGRYTCKLSTWEEEFLMLAGLSVAGKQVFLPLGTRVYVGFPFLQSWAEVEGEVVAWSACEGGGQLMLKCAAHPKLIQRRRHTRMHITNNVLCQVNLPEIYLSQTGTINNLSKSGVCLNLSAPPPGGDKYSLQIIQDNQLPINLTGRLIWLKVAENMKSLYVSGFSIEPTSQRDSRQLNCMVKSMR